jgi:hypothetical protein
MSAHSVLRILAAAVVLAAARHYFHRVPSLPARLRAGTVRLRRAESFQAIAPLFAWSRLAVFLTAYLAVITIGYPEAIQFRVSHNEAANLPARWDAGWYLGIAQSGYYYDRRINGQQNVAFFPALPLAMRAAVPPECSPVVPSTIRSCASRHPPTWRGPASSSA